MSEITPTDTNFPVRIKSALEGDLLVESFTGEEHMSQLFVFHLELVSINPELHFDDVLGQKVTLTLSLADAERHFNGLITEFRYTGASGRFSTYQATVRPWLWFLTRTADCRIFQDMKVPDIIKKVFRDNGMSDFEERLRGSYRKWEYCVQYRESDFNFVSRLMEQEGIYYFFEHNEKSHMMVLADDISAHSSFPGHADVTYHSAHGSQGAVYDDHLDFWTTSQSIVPSRYATQDFNFKKPKVDLLAKHALTAKHAYPLSEPEIFDYPGEYPEHADGVNYVEIRLQELQCQQEKVVAGGTDRGISPGCLFTLKDHPRDDQNKEYLVVSVGHIVNNKDFTSGQSGSSELYRCQTEVIDKIKPFRTARSTPKPLVQGPQTAIVVGPSGEEIYTDEYGRVKVQFHWDRYGKKDQNSSCWVRVSQLWAGAKWGGVHLPRIGQEVIISFMEGDPDQPIITGRVYNADYMPPYELPENKTQSGIKSRSSKEGSADNFNEFRFEDKSGDELIYLHAEKDLTSMVENDEQRTILNTRVVRIGGEDEDKENDKEESPPRPEETIEDLKVFGNRIVDIMGHNSLTVREDQKRATLQTRTISVGGKLFDEEGNEKEEKTSAKEKPGETIETLKVFGSRVIDIKGDDYLTVQEGEVGRKIEVLGGNYELAVEDKDYILTVAGESKTDVKKDITVQGAANINTKAKKSIEIEAGMKITMKAPQSIEMKVGGNSIKIDVSGVTIKGTMVKVEGSAMTMVKGGMVQIN